MCGLTVMVERQPIAWVSALGFVTNRKALGDRNG